MEIVKKISMLQQKLQKLKAENKSIGLVPTMGALHDGHLSLVKKAKEMTDIVVVSIFVNPTQFNDPNDFKSYPKTPEADCQKLAQEGVDFVFLPETDEIYPEKDTRIFDLGPESRVMEGAFRPGHFNGVAQIVSKLFDIVRPDKAFFGEKDYQQVAIIRRMLALLPFTLEIVPCPILRETDGLAMSSRNMLLTAEERKVAPKIHQILSQSRDLFPRFSPHEIKDWVASEIMKEPHFQLDYYEISDAKTLQPIQEWSDCSSAIGCIAVFNGKVRLIDNILYAQE